MRLCNRSKAEYFISFLIMSLYEDVQHITAMESSWQ